MGPDVVGDDERAVGPADQNRSVDGRVRGLVQAVARHALADAGLSTALVAAEPRDVDGYRRLGFRQRDVIRLYQ